MYCFAKVLENGTPLCICKYTLDALCDKYVPNKMISYLKLQTLEFKFLIGVPFLLQIKNLFFGKLRYLPTSLYYINFEPTFYCIYVLIECKGSQKETNICCPFAPYNLKLRAKVE